LVFGMDGALVRFFYDAEGAQARVRMVSSSFLFRLCVALLCSGAAFVTAPMIARLGLGSDAYTKYVRIVAVTLPATLIVLFGMDVLRVTFQPAKFTVLSVLQTVLVSGLSLWFVIRAHTGVVGVLYGRLIGDGISALVAIVLMRHYLRPLIDRARLLKMLQYGAPLVPGAFAFSWIGSVDRYTLQRYFTFDEVALYAVAIKFFAIVSFAISAVNLAFAPHAFAQAREPGSDLALGRQMERLSVLILESALVVALTAPAVLAFLAPPRYAGAIVPAIGLIFAAACWGVYSIFSIPVALALRTSWLAGAAVTGAVLATICHAVFTTRWGAAGAAIATLAGYGWIALSTVWIAGRFRPLPIRRGRIAILGAAIMAMALLTLRLRVDVAGIALRVLTIGAGVVLAFALVPGWFPRWLFTATPPDGRT